MQLFIEGMIIRINMQVKKTGSRTISSGRSFSMPVIAEI
jgi:hypothetical protein